MNDIRHRVCISAPLAQVYEAVATPEGISDWWTRDGVRGEASEGSKLDIFFGDQTEPTAVMEITRLSPAGHVHWNCVEGPDDWVGTKLTFDLTKSDGAESDDETAVMFTHADWRSPSEFMAHCSARWAYFLLSLKLLVETGTGTPVPEDLKF
jgi:uncharacterized protein YndB with AHSA1/START domain